MSDLYSETDILSKIKNAQLIIDYQQFKKLTEFNIMFQKVPSSSLARASNYYKHSTDKYIFQLKENWLEIDIAHELTHGYFMFIENYPMVHCNDSLCQLIRDYMEDIVVHYKINNVYKIRCYENSYLDSRNKLGKLLLKGSFLTDSYWDKISVKCKELHKSFLYIQAWSFNRATPEKEFNTFLRGFEKAYKNKIERELAENIINIIKKNDYLSNKEHYENALNETITIPYIELSKNVIKHFEKDTVGFKLV